MAFLILCALMFGVVCWMANNHGWYAVGAMVVFAAITHLMSLASD